MSLDQIGPLAKNVDDAALVLDVIKGKDNKDTTTFESQPIKLVKPKKATLGILKLNFINPKIQKLIDERTQKVIKQEGWSAKEVSIKHIDLAVQTYYPLVYSEFFSATRRFDGRRYGHKIEEYCGEEVLRRILGGSEITKEEHAGQYYQKALQVKEKIREEIENIFKEVDAIILPVIPSLPWKLSSTLAMKPEEEYAYDALTIPANLAGACALSLPIGNIDKIPMGVQIMCAPFEESKMLSIAKVFESLKE